MIDEKKQTAYAFFWSLFSKFITYLLLLVLANLYLVESYGKSAFVMSIFNIILFFIVVGLPYIFVPWKINKKDISSIFYFLSLLTIIFCILGILISIFYWIWILPLVIALPFVLFYNIGSAFLRIEHKYGKVQFFNTLLILVTLIFAYFLTSFDKLGIISAYALGYIIPTFPLIYLTRDYFKEMLSKFVFDFKIISEYLKKGIIVSLILLSFSLLAWIDSSVLGIFSTFENVAKYNVAMPISNIITLLPLVLSTFLLTKGAELKGSVESMSMLKRVIKISYSFSFVCSAFLIIFLSLILKIFFPLYQGVEFYVSILVIGALFYSAYLLIYTYFTSKLVPEKAFFPLIISATLNILLDIILIPKYGLFGICLATLIAHFFAFTFLMIKVRLLKSFFVLYPLSFLILIFSYLGYFGLVLIPFIIIILFILKLVDLKDIKLLKNLVFSIIKLK